MNQVDQFECDEALLDRFLHNDLDTAQRNDLERHLDSCVMCARRLEDIAAERWTWREVTDCLPSDEFDSRSESDSLPMLEIATSNASEADSQALLSREISGWLDPTDDPDMLGRFAGYEIVGIIGHGGMGIVVKGFESSLNRYVAIKVLAPRLATNGAARKRFSREAQAAAAVRHDNVIAVHRVDEWHGLPFLVMPYVAGISLQKRIDTEGPLSVEAILRIASQVASGLAAAHAQGLVHRDIKPANILLESGVERVTITDFGLARAIDDATITRSGIVAGTPQFMSPEQGQAKPLDHRSDLFSLGSLVYAMATGRPPFRSDDNREVLRKIAEDPARPAREIQPSIPAWLVEIINWLQEKSPDDRPQSADEVAVLLGNWLAHLQQPEVVPEPDRIQPASSPDSPPPPARWRRRILAVAAGLLAIMAGVILILETSKGTIRIESELDGVPIEVKKGDHVVESLTVSKNGASVRVAAGEYVVDIEGDIDGMIVRDGQVAMKRGDKYVVTIVQQERDAAAESPNGNPLGDERLTNPRYGATSGVVPPWERWESRFSTTVIQTYARQLDFFGIELGTVGSGSQEIDYAYNLAEFKPARRSGKAEDEQRLYMVSQHGGAAAEFDRQLIERAGITTQRRLILHFYPKEIEELLARLETQANREAGHTDPREFLKTTFGVRRARDKYEFYVKDQYFRLAPMATVSTDIEGLETDIASPSLPADYVLQPEDITISENSPVPPWIHSDIKAEVFHKGSLNGLSILDRQVAVKVAQAFKMHAWVETVTRVSKHYPARVVVEMAYRKPVAMVEVVMGGEDGLLPIDIEGVLLPTEDFRIPPDDYPGCPDEFQAEQSRKYLRISVADATPPGLTGSVWGDRRVVGAARIAAVLHEHWERLGLYLIAARATDAFTDSTAEPSYDLLTRNGVRVIWGKAPDAKNAAEARAALDKVAKLVAYNDSNTPVKSMNKPAEIDLRGRAVFGPAPERKPAYSSDQTQADLKRLQGGWELIAYEDADGRHPVTVNHEKHQIPFRIVIEGTEFTGPYFPHIGPPRESRLELDANKSPKQLHLTVDAGNGTLEISHMLYRFRGEHLELSFANENARGLIPARFRMGKNSDNLITAVFKRIHHGEEELPAKTYTSEGARYTYGSRQIPSNAKPTATLLSLLSDAIREFNQRQRQHSIGRHQPPLTDDEVIAAIRRARLDRHEFELSDDELQRFQSIAETGLLPAGWSFEFLTDIELPDGSRVKVWSVRLTLDRDNGTGYTFEIRQRALEYRPVAGQPADESTDPAEGRVSLSDLVSEFNQRMRLSDQSPESTGKSRGTGPGPGVSTQPPVTVDEIVAAIRLQLNRESNRKWLSAANWRTLETIAATRSAPKGTVLGFLERLSLVTFRYDQWSCRLKVSTPEGNFVCNVRSQFLRSTEIPRVGDDEIAWGPPAEDGLQVGVQLARVDAGRFPGEKYAPRFFFRNRTGKTVAAFEHRIDYFEVDARSATGEKLPVKRRTNDVVISIPIFPVEVASDTRLEKPGAPILIGGFDAKQFEEARFLNGNDPFTFDDPVAAVNAKTGEPVRLRFRLPHPANLEGPQIITGEIRVVVGANADQNVKKAI